LVVFVCCSQAKTPLFLLSTYFRFFLKLCVVVFLQVQDRIALDIIRGRLDEDNPEHYSFVKDFLADLRKMFR